VDIQYINNMHIQLLCLIQKNSELIIDKYGSENSKSRKWRFYTGSS
jgi:hypothetical protein